jgi:hypothetical protein
MWAYIKFALGLLIMFAAVNGAFTVFNGGAEKSARRIVENGVNANGVVEKRTQHIVAGRYGKAVGGGVYYTLSYNFTTIEGVKYGGKINVTKEQAYSVRDGEKIVVRYMKGQPSINAPLRFKEYMSEQDIAELPYEMMAFSFALFFLGGLWLCWANWSQVMPAPNSRPSTVNINRVSSIPRRNGTPAAGFGRR